MLKNRNRLIQTACLSLILSSSAQADEMPSRAEMWKMLQQQGKTIEELKSHIKDLAGKGSQGGVVWSDAHTKHHAVLRSPEEKKEGTAALAWANRITLGGVVEVEAGASNNADGDDDDGSNVALATVELGIDAVISELVNAHVLLLHEDGGGTPINVDEATITFGNPEKYPVYLTAGRMAVPFGNFTTNMVSDPLTLSMGETKESALQVGFEASGFNGSVYLFNGDANQTGKDDSIRQFGGNVDYTMEKNDLTLDVGISYTNSMDDSDAVWDVVKEISPEKDKDSVTVVDNVAGVGVHGKLGYQGFSLIGEYLGATESFAVGELPWKDVGAQPVGAQPVAWNTELGYTFDLMGKETTLAAAWQGSDEAQALGLPEDRYLAAVSVGIFDNTSLSLEWFIDEGYGTGDGRTDNDAYSGTFQLAVEF